jgi:hypothetical protein
MISYILFNLLHMKKYTYIIMFFLFFAISQCIGQTIPTYPIPSYDVTVNGLADFSSNANHLVPDSNSREKRQIIIRIRRSSELIYDCSATVWVYSLDETSVLGPYQVNCDSLLQVDIDNREWGVLVQSVNEVIVDVWIDE